MAKKKGDNTTDVSRMHDVAERAATCGDEHNLHLMRLGNMVERHQCDTSTVIDRLSEFIDAVPRDAPPDAVIDYCQGIRDGQQSVDEAVREVVAITRDTRVNRLNQEVNVYHDIAEKWAAKGPDITLREACHGVAHDAYALRFDTNVPRPMPEDPAFNPSKVYGAMYDTNLADEIKARQIRAAKELFRK